jgi:N4-gp56 family major capsid protein
MATSPAVNTNLVRSIISAKVWEEGNKEQYFGKFTSKTGDSIIHLYEDLKKERGDSITIPLRHQLAGNWITGDNTLEGYEEAINFYDFKITVDQERAGVLSAGKMSEQKYAFDVLEQMKAALKQLWMNYLEDKHITALSTTATAGEVIYAPLPDATAVASIASITADCKLTAAQITRARVIAEMHSPIIQPVRVNGKEYFVMFVHPYAAKNLKEDTTFINAQKDAAERGINNPLFTGMLGVYDGVVLHEFRRVQLTTDGASSANVCHNLLCGKQAGVMAVAKTMFMKEKVFDYENQTGYAVGWIGAIAKSQFNSHDYGILKVVTGGSTVS